MSLFLCDSGLFFSSKSCEFTVDFPESYLCAASCNRHFDTCNIVVSRRFVLVFLRIFAGTPQLWFLRW